MPCKCYDYQPLRGIHSTDEHVEDLEMQLCRTRAILAKTLQHFKANYTIEVVSTLPLELRSKVYEEMKSLVTHKREELSVDINRKRKALQELVDTKIILKNMGCDPSILDTPIKQISDEISSLTDLSDDQLLFG